MEDCVSHFQLRPHLKLSQECLTAQWQEGNRQWQLTFRDLASSRSYQIQARYLITAVGVLNIPKGLDDLPLLREFSGSVFHTSQWRDVDFDRKRVMVIGNGCSANQVIPWILRERSPKSIVQLVRSPHWVAPKPNYTISGWTKW